MHELSTQELDFISGGMSDTAVNCFEGGALGLVGGAFIGGVVAYPVYYMLMNQEGISSSHHLFGWMLVVAGTAFGGLLGSFIGTGGGWLASCAFPHHTKEH